MKVNTVSVKQLRENFGQVKEGIESGLTYLLIYRSQPLAEIRPVEQVGKIEFNQKEKTKENAKKVKSLAGGLRLGKGLTPGQMNKLYDQTYENLLS